MAIARDDEKLAEAVLLVAELLLDDPAGGALKLNKVLYFADFAHVRTHGRPITGAEYQKLQYGPAPRRLLPVREQLLETGAAELRPENFFGHRQDRLEPLRPANRALFSADELAALERAVQEVGGQTGTQVSDLSHQDMGWQMVEEGETIPYAVAYLRRPVVTERIRRRAAELAVRDAEQ